MKKLIQKTFQVSTLVAALGCSIALFADAPVMDASPAGNGQSSAQSSDQNNDQSMPALAQPGDSNSDNNGASDTNANAPATDTSGMTDQQRLTRLEQQMANLTKMNLSQQMSNLQDQMQSLSGQVQVQNKQLSQLNKQQRDFYQEVDSRINQLNTLINNTTSTSATTNNTAPVTPPTSDASQKSDASDNTDTSDATSNASQSNNNGNAPVNNSQQELTMYQNAFSMVLAKNLKGAEKALYHYLSTYPNGQYAANAHYWLGEIALQDQDYLASQKQFNVVVTQFPKNQKVADARLKLATILVKLGKTAQATTALQAIINDYPASPSAQLAQVQLNQLKAGK